MRRALQVATVAALLLVTGCTGAPGGSGATGDSTAETNAADTTTVATDTPTSTVACTATPEYPSVTVPERPESLTAANAKNAVDAYESQYRKAWLAARSNLSYYNYIPNRRTTTGIDGGYRVTVHYYAEYGTTGGPNGTSTDAHRPFTVQYSVTTHALVREGTTIACW